MTADPQMPVEELEGRELDKAVHREVFGWTFTEDMPVGTGEHVIDGDEEWRECHPTAAPLYSSEIRDAWKVVGEVGGGITIWHGADKFRVCWTDNYSSALEVCQHTRPDVTADTAPEAICRAALKAVRQ